MKKLAFSSGVAAAVIAATASAGDYSLKEAVVAGGGGVSSGGQYSVAGAVGQPAVTVLAGGAFTIESGFWAMIAVVPTTGAPAISIRRQGGTVVLSWPSAASGFTLEQSPTASPAAWTPAPAAVADDGSFKSATVQLAPGMNYFRLRKP